MKRRLLLLTVVVVLAGFAIGWGYASYVDVHSADAFAGCYPELDFHCPGLQIW